MEVNINTKRVANTLKKIVNASCPDGFIWFPEVGETDASLWDVIEAIKVLDSVEEKTIHILDDMEAHA